MLVGYYDRGGDDQVTIVAGYISHASGWQGFDQEWRALLDAHDVPYFHMREFAHSTGTYSAGWKGQHRRRRVFLTGLIDIIQRHAFRSFGSAVTTEVFDDFLRQDSRAATLFPSAYAYCARHVVAKARLWARTERWTIPVKSVFEAGDPGWGRLVEVLTRDGHPVPVRRPKVATGPEEASDCLSPLQAADFAAYEMLKFFRLVQRDDVVWEDVRESFKALERSVHSEWGITSLEDMREFADMLFRVPTVRSKDPGDTG